MDKTIPYYPVIMCRKPGSVIPDCIIPSDYKAVLYKIGETERSVAADDSRQRFLFKCQHLPKDAQCSAVPDEHIELIQVTSDRPDNLAISMIGAFTLTGVVSIPQEVADTATDSDRGEDIFGVLIGNQCANVPVVEKLLPELTKAATSGHPSRRDNHRR